MTRPSLRQYNKPGRPAGGGKLKTHGPMIVEALRLGLPVTIACHKVGLGYTTFREWMRLGETDPNSPYAAFVVNVNEAKALFAEEMVEHVKEAAKLPQNWTAAMTLLERIYPEEFGRKNPDTMVAIQNNTNTQVNIDSQTIKEKMKQYEVIFEDKQE